MHAFTRLLIWTKDYLVQRTRPRERPTGSPVVPLVCGELFVGVKLPYLAGRRRRKTTVLVHGAGRTMIRRP